MDLDNPAYEPLEEVLEATVAAAATLGQTSAGTEHLLLALLATPGTADILTARGLSPSGLPERIQRIHRGEAGPDSGTYTPRVMGLLENALAEAAAYGETKVRPEHLLAVLLREKSGVARRIMIDLDVDLSDLVIGLSHQPVLGMRSRLSGLAERLGPVAGANHSVSGC